MKKSEEGQSSKTSKVIGFSTLMLDRVLNKTRKSIVHSAMLSEGDEKKKVAVKTLLSQDETDKHYFDHEIEMYEAFEKKPGVFIVRYFGHGIDPDNRKFIALELSPTYNLMIYLEKFGTPKIKLQMSVDTMAALAWLHQEEYVHRDFRLSNFVVMADNTVKLVDLESVQKLDPQSHRYVSEHLSGSPDFFAPELLDELETHPFTDRGFTYNKETDAYAAGIHLWVVWCVQVPFGHYNLSTQIPKQFIQGVRLFQERPSSPQDIKIPKSVSAIMKRLWVHQPSERPSISQAVTELKAIEESELKPLAP